MSPPDLVAHLAHFAAGLRERGVGVDLRDEADGVEALSLSDLADREEVRCALRIALKIRRRDWATFDALFDHLWAGGRPPEKPAEARPAPAKSGETRWLAARKQFVLAGAEGEDLGGDGELPGYSPEALLRKKPFDQCSEQDLAAMARLLARLTLKLATYTSRRFVPTRGRGEMDLRRSLRRIVSTGGELVSLARRKRAVEETRLVLLCDTSGSMDPYTRFLLAFVLSLREVARRSEIFVFNTGLTRITPWIAPHKIAPVLDRLAAGVPDWSGGTRIGESLAQFVANHQIGCVNGRSVVVILSDGLDRGDTSQLALAMRALQRRARKVIWLNPLLGDPRYEPTARGMEAALPFVDHFLPAHNLESLERLLPLLGRSP